MHQHVLAILSLPLTHTHAHTVHTGVLFADLAVCHLSLGRSIPLLRIPEATAPAVVSSSSWHCLHTLLACASEWFLFLLYGYGIAAAAS